MNEYFKNYYEKNKEKIALQRKLVRQKNKSEHSVCSPSSLHRLMVCPASAVLTRFVKEASSTTFAREGTIFHECMEYIIKNKLDDKLSEEWIKSFIKEKTDELSEDSIKEMIGCVVDAVEWFKIEFVTANKVYSEIKLPMFYSDQDWGTSDVGILYDNKLVIVDWKYGKGVNVSADNNPQLISYAVSMLKYLSQIGVNIKALTEVETIIYQPRIWGDKIKSCKYSLIELIEHSKSIKESVDKVYEILGKYTNRKSKIVTSNLHTSEEACRFCPAKMDCTKYVRQNEDLLTDLASDMTLANTSKANKPVNLVEIGKKFEEYLPKLEAFYKEIENYFLDIKDNLPEGVFVKNRAGRLNYIKDTEKVIKVLRDNKIDVIDHSIKLVTITELKKLIKTLENRETILETVTETKQGSEYITFKSTDLECLTDL